MKKVLVNLFFLLLLFQNYTFAEDTIKVISPNPKCVETICVALGTYSDPPRLESAHVDFKCLLAELKDIHANTCSWLILRKQMIGKT